MLVNLFNIQVHVNECDIEAIPNTSTGIGPLPRGMPRVRFLANVPTETTPNLSHSKADFILIAFFSKWFDHTLHDREFQKLILPHVLKV